MHRPRLLFLFSLSASLAACGTSAPDTSRDAGAGPKDARSDRSLAEGGVAHDARRPEDSSLADTALGVDGAPVQADAARPRVDAGPATLGQSVNPFIGTAAGAPGYGIGNARGDTFPGAVVPFGMVQLSPDTTTAPGGYDYGDSTIHGFSVTHFSGRGVSCYEDIPLMPSVGTVTMSPGTSWRSYGSGFSHAMESASPGYYSVTLTRSNIGVELTATPRTGMYRIHFPTVAAEGSARPLVLVNAGGSANGDQGGTGIEITGPRSIRATAVSGNCGGAFTYTLYYAAEFDQPFVTYGTWNGSTVTSGSASSSGAESGAYLTFDAAVGTVAVKVGLSWVSAAQAEANLQAENPGWDFDAVEASARAAWEERLGSVLVTGGTSDERSVFYTAMYHAQIHPSVFSDADGQYIGFDQRIHSAPGHTQFHNFPGWDNYRSQMRLLPLIDADLMGDMMQSLVNDAAEDPGGGLPRWEHANANSGGMIGDSQDAVLAGAHAFGITNFDVAGAVAAIRRGAELDTTTSSGHTVREGLDSYLHLGFVDTTTEAAGSRTLEYASDDFATSRLLSALGDPAAPTYLTRSHDWQNLWNAADGYLEPRNLDGTFTAGFDPTSDTGWTESNGDQYLWLVPFDLGGLIAKLGGPTVAMARLDAHVTALNAGPGSAQLFMGNEPEEGTPWIYDWGGQPWKTQALTRSIWLTLYANTPGGYPGNDDGGALSSWVVFAALGLYPEIPGVAGFAVGSPLFPDAVVRLPGGTLHVTAPTAADDAPYVQALSWQGAPHASPWIDYADIASGGTLAFTLGTAPNASWGSDPTVAPPSFE